MDPFTEGWDVSRPVKIEMAASTEEEEEEDGGEQGVWDVVEIPFPQWGGKRWWFVFFVIAGSGILLLLWVLVSVADDFIKGWSVVRTRWDRCWRWDWMGEGETLEQWM